MLSFFILGVVDRGELPDIRSRGLKLQGDGNL